MEGVRIAVDEEVAEAGGGSLLGCAQLRRARALTLQQCWRSSRPAMRQVYV